MDSVEQSPESQTWPISLAVNGPESITSFRHEISATHSCKKKARQSLLWILYHAAFMVGLVLLWFTLYLLGVTR